ncbi:hypothetical protein [Virgibacillus alimentarius]|uniref:Uncharacterized protein n=1 Tax=Virgibacillus alimentarius TaxID=698769 RepID=A0ABS4SAN2_9BACI|nr:MULTISPECIES: hypothetical protein [Virgibacillus]MBP2258555.1 hypothetical protein [Virgibacillus alimentarius]HLR68452.1 hypothetical protein [Virgibacillus sp.]
MFIMNERQIRDEKMKQLKKGQSAYAESYELIRLLLRDIKKYNLQVHCDRTNIGCWFIPISDQE